MQMIERSLFEDLPNEGIRWESQWLNNLMYAKSNKKKKLIISLHNYVPLVG